MMFKKIDVEMSHEDALALANAVLSSYLATEKNVPCPEDMLNALKEHVLNISEPFEMDKWHSCTEPPPAKFSGANLIIRRKGVRPVGDVNDINCTSDVYAYVLGWYSDGDYAISPSHNAFNVLKANINGDLESYEYLVIKYV